MGALRFTAKDILLISAFRENSRKTLTKMSSDLHMPISTIFEKLKRYEKILITRYTALINFQNLGFDVKVKIILRTSKEKRQHVQQFLLRHSNVNSLARITNGYDFMVEAVFRNMRELHDFTEKLESLGIEDKREYYILEDLRREGFLSDRSNAEIII
jgi:Lrp/AsnC family leucine-responsive transcriptional regulator